MKRILYILIALLAVMPVLAQADDSTLAPAEAHSLSLDSALALARLNNRSLREARLDIDDAREVRREARTKYFPQVSATAVGYLSLQPILRVGADDLSSAQARDILNTLYADYGAALGLPNSISMFQHGVMATVSAVQPVYMGGKIVAGNRLARVGVEAARTKAVVAERDLMLTVEESYWLVTNLEAKRATVDAVTRLVDTLSSIVAVAVDAGISTPSDMLQVEMSRDELVAKRLQLENGIALARQALCQSIGIEYDPALRLDSLDISGCIPPVSAAEAVNRRPESALLDMQIRAEQLRRRMTLADALPSVVVGGVYGYMNIASPFGADARRQYLTTDQSRYLNGVLGVVVNVPLTGWWETAHSLRRGDIAIARAELQRDELTEKMRLQTIQAYDQATETAALVQQYSAALTRARENLRLADLNYRNGLSTVGDYLQAQTLYMQAENNLTDARVNYRVALRRYMSLSF